MKRLFIISLLSICLAISAYAKDTKQSYLSNKIDSLSTIIHKNELEIECLSKKIDIVNYGYSIDNSLVSNSTAIISNELEAGNRTFTIFSIVIAVLGLVIALLSIGLGVYITKQANLVSKLLKEVNDKKDIVEKLKEDVTIQKEEVEQLNSQIHNDMSGLYDKLRREETKMLLDRLIKVPMDIYNIAPLLMSRDMERDDFDKLLKAYNNLKEEGFSGVGPIFIDDVCINGYFTLFFQHFLDISINEASLKGSYSKLLNNGCECAFPSDIKKSTKDLIAGINKWKDSDKLNILCCYCRALICYQYSYKFNVFNCFVEKISDKELCENIFEQLRKIEDKSIIPFATALKKKYGDDKDFVQKIDADIESLSFDKSTSDNITNQEAN